jgi:flagellar motor switch protein FliN
MGRHDVMDHMKTPTKAFRWPALPELTLEAARIEAHLFRSPTSVRQKIAGKVVTLTGPVQAPKGPQLAADVVFGGNAIRVYVPQDAIGALLALHGIEDDWRSYGPQTAALVTEHLLAEATAPLEAVLGGPLRVDAVLPAPDGPSGPALHLKVTTGTDQTATITLSAKPDLLAQLVAMIGKDCDAAEVLDLDDLPFPVRLIGPAFTVTSADLAAAEVGDGFFLEKDWSGLFTADVTVADHLAATARYANGGLHLTSEFSKRSKTNTSKEAHMSFTAATKADVTATLPVTVRIELAETTMTLSDLLALGTGSVLPFAEDLPTTVGLVANGKAFARGDLVRIDGKIAVRLTEIC